MPRNVRNWWITAKADGRHSSVAFGPRARDGGFSLIVYQRDKGDIRTAFQMEGKQIDGKLVLIVRGDSTNEMHVLKTER